MVTVKRIDGGWEIYRDGVLIGTQSTVYLAECDGYRGRLIPWKVPDPFTRDQGYAEFQKGGRIVRW